MCMTGTNFIQIHFFYSYHEYELSDFFQAQSTKIWQIELNHTLGVDKMK